MMKKYYITGVPGIGKTTVMKELQNRGYTAFDLDYIPGLCGWFNKTTKESVEWLHGASEDWHKAHGWYCDVKKLQDRLKSLQTDQIFISGLVENQREVSDLCNKTFFLDAEPDVFMERMANRSEEHFGHHEEDRKTVLITYPILKREMRGIGAIRIDATQSVDQIVDEILRQTQAG